MKMETDLTSAARLSFRRPALALCPSCEGAGTYSFLSAAEYPVKIDSTHQTDVRAPTHATEASSSSTEVATAQRAAIDEYAPTSPSLFATTARSAGGPPRRAFHIVAEGETLYGLSKRYGVTVDQLKRFNGISSDSLQPNTRIGIPGHVEVTVRPGETLYSIAQRYGTTAAELAKKNGLREQDLQAHQTLIVPGRLGPVDLKVREGLHVVQDGEYLRAIAARYNVSVEAFIRVNPSLQKSTVLRRGQKLQIPGRLWANTDDPIEKPTEKPTRPVDPRPAVLEVGAWIDGRSDSILGRALGEMIAEDPSIAPQLLRQIEPALDTGTMKAYRALNSDLNELAAGLEPELESATALYARRFRNTDPRIGFLLFMTGRALPTRMAGKGDMIKAIMQSHAGALERDLQEMAAMVGDPPFGFEQVYENITNDAAWVTNNAIEQLDLTPEQRELFAEKVNSAVAQRYVEILHEAVPDVGPDLQRLLEHALIKKQISNLIKFP